MEHLLLVFNGFLFSKFTKQVLDEILGKEVVMEKILFISNIAKKVGSFSIASIMAAQECGIQFHMAANWNSAEKDQIKSDEKEYNVKIHNIQLDRLPYSLKNFKAYKQLVEIIRNEGIDYIHCNTPVGGILGRLVGKKCKVKKVIYQAHGFHFYRGATLKNWLLYYPVERWLAHYTDVIITINNEDYERAKKFKLRNNGKVYYVPGVGIDTSQYHTDKGYRIKKRKELGLAVDDIALISIGDLIERKNYSVAIEAVAKTKNSKLQYFICGTGREKEKLMNFVKTQGIERQVHFLDYRDGIKELLQVADIFLFSTLQEGLSRSLMEAMASGLPCIVGGIRGDIELLNGSNGVLLCEGIDDYVKALDKLTSDNNLRRQMGINNLEAILHYGVDETSQNIRKIDNNEREDLIGYFPAWARKRREIGISLSATLLISVGELNKNKNNQVIIEALGRIKDKSIHYVLCGVGDKEKELRKKVHDLGLDMNVHFLGYRLDIKELLNASDIFVMPSLREGLSRSIMEAMASGLPCVVSNIRGNRDLIKDGIGGFLCNAKNVDDFERNLKKIILNRRLRVEMSIYNLESSKDYDTEKIKMYIAEIYRFCFS